MDKKKSFIMYLSYEENFQFLSDKELGVLLRGIFHYVKTGEIPDFNNNSALLMAFSFIKTNIDRDTDKYISKCQKNSEIAKKREQKKREAQCHLGSKYKIESCFKCLKKNRCPLKESSEFRLKHNCTFEEWDAKQEQLYEKWCKDRLKNGEKIGKELFDYNWLEDN